MPSTLPNQCSSCPEAWQEWLAAHAHIPPPVVSASRKRKTFDRFFGTYTPPSERTVLGGRSSCAEPGCSSHPMDPQSVRRAEATPAAVDLTAYETLEDEEVPLDAPRPSRQTQEDATPPSTSYATPDERVTLLGGGSAPAGCTTQDTGPEPPRIATASTSEGASARKPPSQEETPPAEAGPRHQPSPSLTSEVAQLSGCLQPGAGAEAASGGCGRGEMGTPIPGLTPAKDAPGSALQPLSGNAVTASRALRGKAATDSSYRYFSPSTPQPPSVQRAPAHIPQNSAPHPTSGRLTLGQFFFAVLLSPRPRLYMGADEVIITL